MVACELKVETLTIEFIELTYCHDQYPKTIVKNNRSKSDPLIDTSKHKGWKVNPMITILMGGRGAIHKHLAANLKNDNMSP